MSWSEELVLFSIKAVIAESVEAFVVYVDDELLDELESGERRVLALVVFVALVPEGNVFPVIGEDPGLRHGRAAYVARDVVGGEFGRVELRGRRMDVKAVFVV